MTSPTKLPQMLARELFVFGPGLDPIDSLLRRLAKWPKCLVGYVSRGDIVGLPVIARRSVAADAGRCGRVARGRSRAGASRKNVVGYRGQAGQAPGVADWTEEGSRYRGSKRLGASRGGRTGTNGWLARSRATRRHRPCSGDYLRTSVDRCDAVRVIEEQDRLLGRRTDEQADEQGPKHYWFSSYPDRDANLAC